MSKRTMYVHRTRGTVHETDCRWLAGSFAGSGKNTIDNYREVPAEQVRRGMPRCSWCAPAVRP